MEFLNTFDNLDFTAKFIWFAGHTSKRIGFVPFRQNHICHYWPNVCNLTDWHKTSQSWFVYESRPHAVWNPEIHWNTLCLWKHQKNQIFLSIWWLYFSNCLYEADVEQIYFYLLLIFYYLLTTTTKVNIWIQGNIIWIKFTILYEWQKL